MKGKKASQHLEMIIAFILFSSFVFFLLYFLPIPKQSHLEESTIFFLQNFFENKTQKDLIEISLKTNSTSCFLVPLQGIPENYNSIIKDEFQYIVNSFASESRITIDSEKNFFFIYLFEDFEDAPALSCPELSSNNYTLGGIKKNKIISSSSLADFIKSYDEDYEILKQSMGLPINMDFAIKISGIQLEDSSPGNSEVLAKTKNYKILYPDGTIENKEVTFIIWS